eukprot:Amastigsp_a174855_155.p2 type:complete len:107 gc:universal Amastigsp_a174855_155:399-79(-)
MEVRVARRPNSNSTVRSAVLLGVVHGDACTLGILCIFGAVLAQATVASSRRRRAQSRICKHRGVHSLCQGRAPSAPALCCGHCCRDRSPEPIVARRSSRAVVPRSL